MSAILMQNGKQAFTDANSRPLIGGRVFLYAPNTNTPKDTWQDSAQTILNTNPIILDARGEAAIYGDGPYRQVLRDSDGNLIWDSFIPDLVGSVKDAVNDVYARSSVVVNNIADLRVLSKLLYKNAQTSGYYTAGDSGGSSYYLDTTDTTSADNGGTVIVATDGGRWKMKPFISASVRQFGAKGDGATDDTARVQAAMTACRDVFVPPGTYMLNTTIFVPSSTTIHGEGAVSKFKALSTFVMINVAWAGGQLPVMFGNQGILTSAAAERIEIYGIMCDSSLTSNGVHNIHMRNTNYTKIHHNTFAGGADGTAHTMASNFQVTNNLAYGMTNCCYDQWEGSSAGIVANNIGYVTLGYGMLLTGDTSLNTPAQSANVVFSGNIIFGDGTANSSIGIWFQSGANLTSNCYSCRAVGNYVRGFRVGIRATGGGQHVIAENRIENCDIEGISLSAEVVGNPVRYTAVTGNVINNSGNVGGAAITLGSGASNNTITANVTSAVTSTHAAIIASGCNDNVFSANNFEIGTVGYLADNGLRNQCGNTRSGFYETGSFTPTLTTSGGGVPSYAAQYGNYEIVGKYCYFSGRVSINALGSLAAGTIQITGLPKVSNSTTLNNQPPVMMSSQNASGGLSSRPTGRVPSGAARVDLYKWAGGSDLQMVLGDITATFEVTFQGRYQVA